MSVPRRKPFCRAVLVGEGDADLHPAVFLVHAGTGDDGVDFAIGFGHGGYKLVREKVTFDVAFMV